MSSIQPQDKLRLLRELLLAEDRHDLIALRQELDALEKSFAEQKIKSLTNLLREQGGRDAEHFDSYVAALQEGTESCIERSVNTDKTRLASALFPIMGPAIRSYVAELFRSLAEDLNNTLQNATSVERIRWRLQARVSGVPFTEYVALRTANFRVEELYLMEKGTGLLIQHVAADPDHESLKDADLMSGMLTAIRSFTRDVFGEDSDGDGIPDGDEELNRFTFGDRQVLIEGAPTTILAAVVRGTPPAIVREKMKSVLEALHQRIGVAEEEGDEIQDDTRGELLGEAMLEAHAPAAEASGGGMWRAWLFLGILAIGIAAWIGYRFWDGLRWQRFADELRAQPGIEVMEADRNRIIGLRDPEAIRPIDLAPDAEKADLTFVEYHSLYPEFVARREQARMDELSDIKKQSADAISSAVAMGEQVAGAMGKLSASLDATERKLATAEQQIVERLDAAEASRRRQIEELLSSRFAQAGELDWQFSGSGIRVSGAAAEPFYSQIIDQLAAIESLGTIDTSALENLSGVTLAGLLGEFPRALVLYESGSLDLLAGSATVAKLQRLIEQVDAIADDLGERYEYRIMSHPLIGANRAANKVVEQQRADNLRRRLIDAGIDGERLTLELSNDLTKAGLGVEVVPVSTKQ